MKLLKRYSVFILIFFYVSLNAQERSIMLLDTNWRFFNRDIQDAAMNYFDDSAWESVTVPHDWAIRDNFDMNLDAQMVQVVEDGEKVPRLRTGRTGALPMFGVGWYRKVLSIMNEDKGKRIFIEFDGAMSFSKIYLNGKYVGEWPYDYSSFTYELTDYVKFGEDN